MTIPLPHTVEHRAYAGTGEDSHGNEIPQYAAGVDIPAFWHAPLSSEPFLAGHDRVIVDLVVVVDSAVTIAPRDRLAVDGLEYEVIGQEDYDHGPFGWVPNRRPVNVKRIEG